MSLRNAVGKQTVTDTSKKLREESTTESSTKEQRGKRAEGEYLQLNVVIPKELKLRFKSVTALREQDMSEVCETLISDWLEHQ